MNNGRDRIHDRTKGLNLIYIIGTYPVLTTTFIDREINSLRQLGVNIQVVSIRHPSKQLSPEQKVLQQSVLYLLPVSKLSFIVGHLRFALLYPLVYFGTLFYLLTRPHPSMKSRFMTFLHFAEGVYAASLLRDRHWDHIHAHFVDRAATVALCVGRLLKVSYSLTAHANDIYIQQILIHEKIAESKFTVTVSEFNKAYLLKQCPGLHSDNLFVLHPWVDLSHFQPPETRPDHARLRIMSVGRLVEKKGHRYLIEACHLLQEAGVDFECHILGDGPLEAELEAMVARYNLAKRVHLMGRQPQQEVLARLSQADVFVLACVIANDGDRDGMPVAVAEAMAMEVPVISTDIVGIREMVKPGAGCLVPPKDAVALAEAIKSLQAAGTSARMKMGKHGRAIIAEEFDVFKGTRRLADLFQKTVDEKKGCLADLSNEINELA